MATSYCRHEGPSVLLVEGVDDCHTILALCGKYSIPENFGIFECGGEDRVLKRINALISQPSPPEIIGAVLDADQPDLAGRWASVRQKLARYQYPFPDEPDKDGTILQSKQTRTRLGFWLMPNNQVAGMLEDFCLEMLSKEARSTAESAVLLAQGKSVSTFKMAHMSKAVLHTYLAWQDEPGKPLGQAITAESLRASTVNAQNFVAWLGRLFEKTHVQSAVD